MMQHLLVFAFLATFQSQLPATDIHLEDGSKLRVKLLDKTIEVKTAYGTLQIPAKEISKIHFGLHVADALEIEARRHVKNLGAEQHKEREAATKALLDMGPRAYWFVLEASKSPDLEISQRVEAILKVLRDKYPPSKLKDKVPDVLQTKSFPVHGEIQTKEFKCHSATLGEVTLKIHSITSLVTHDSVSADVTLNADYFGTEYGTWQDSGVLVSGGIINVSASGMVDLWPQGAGQYMAGPNGHVNTAGQGGFLSAALIGKIGDGTPFLIGERMNRGFAESGRLYLAIVPSPWNAKSAGGYTVKIQVGEE